MELTEKDAGQIDRFVTAELDSSLLQSWSWGEFQKKIGRNIARVGVRRGDELVAVATIIEHDLPFGLSYAYAPRGPVVKGQSLNNPDKEALNEISKELKAKADEWGAVFIRIDPPIAPAQKEKYLSVGFREAANQIQPKITALLDLSQDREQILADMKSKTRYNIRLALKKEVEVRESIQPSDLEKFLELQRETTERDRFTSHPDDYYRNQLAELGPAGLFKLFVAEYKGQPIASIAVAFHGKTATYLHGASSNQERNRMPTFAVQWEAIKMAQRMGLQQFDFHGVAPDDDPKHPWAGITRFKLGFGAKRHEYMGALDLPLKKFQYWLYALRLRMRRSDGR